MSEQCSPASYEQIGAIYVPGRLIIWASGKTVNQFFKVKIDPSLLRIYPPMYDLVACSDGFVPMLYNPTPYKAFASFERGKPKEDYIPVNTSEGRIQVPLFVLDPMPFDSSVDIDAANLASEAGSAMPASFGGSVPTLFRLPVNLSKVFETGNSEDVEIPKYVEATKKVEAIGYSFSFSFDEAFQNALSHLPPDDNVHPDKLTTVHVDSIAAELGGIIGGGSRMRVTVSSIY